MRLLNRIAKSGFIPKHRLLELFPPFLFMGVRFESVSDDYRRIKLSMPLRWYGKNPHGTMFGGFMCAVADPLPALVCGELFRDHEVWTQSNHLDFRKPGHDRVYMELVVTDEDVREIREALARDGKVSHRFHCRFTDRKGGIVAEVRNTVYLRVRPRKRQD